MFPVVRRLVVNSLKKTPRQIFYTACRTHVFANESIGCGDERYPAWESTTPLWVQSSKQSPEPKVLTPPPPSTVVWPQFAKDLAQSFVDSGFTHLKFVYRPRMYFSGAAHDAGRESIETYFKPGPNHPRKPAPYIPVFPQSPTPLDIPSLQGSTAVRVVSSTKPVLTSEPILDHPSYPSPTSMGSLVALMHFGPYSTGFPESTHGGQIATAADFFMYDTVEKSGISGFTVNMNINYRNIIPVGNVTVMRTNVEFFEGRKATAHFGIFSPDHTVLYTEGSAIFVRPKDSPTPKQ